jgi:hypothetical protein
MSFVAVWASLALSSTLELPGASSRRHLRQGLKPADSAAAALEKKVQLSRFGFFAGHTGLQYTTVVETPVKKRPSKRVSLTSKARYQVSGLNFMIAV